MVRCLLAVVGVLRMFGGFPYTWNSSSSPTFTRRTYLVAWSVICGLLAAVLVFLPVSLHKADFPVLSKETRRTSLTISVNISWITVAALLSHTICHHTKLCKLLQSVCQLPFVGHQQGFSKTGLVVCVSTLLVVAVCQAGNLMVGLLFHENVPPVVRTLLLVRKFTVDNVAYIVPLLFHLTLTLLARSLKIASCTWLFPSSPHKMECDPEAPVVITHEDQTNTSCGYIALSRQEDPTTFIFIQNESTSQETFHELSLTDIRMMRNYVLTFNVVLEDLLGYFQLPVLVLLFNDLVLITTRSYLLIVNDTNIFTECLSIIFGSASFTRTLLLIISPRYIVKQRQDIARRLRRYKMNPVPPSVKEEIASFVTTYAIIAYQLEIGENTTTNTTTTTCL
ncbi:uncharacterized protein LOC121853240 isoform X2 [Homarus americanus]|uniref:uncharacterized protein LOC121853240 isoform X2 n=1 Tax=Homarus americanus TaxID=6706 RepID=UPI001C453FC6|nr:uncharacterized protein LOC121853240 isoform X2 [Homarus americanus]